MTNFSFCDMHSHILPGMDDGSKNTDMSLQMLRSCAQQGIEQVFLTPHYYPVESVKDFLQRRDKAEAQLRQAMEACPEQLPQICTGAEVAYRPGIGYEEDLELLRLGKSEFLLLELPFSPWDKEVIRDIRNMVCARGITPIIAHIEWYLSFQKKEILQEVLAQGVLVQMNGEALLSWRTRGKARKMLARDMVQLLGSDSHNMTDRAPNLSKRFSSWRRTRLCCRCWTGSATSARIFLDRPRACKNM